MGLFRDTTGAILLLGIALGTALAAAVFYLVGLGEGILWREAAQNAADAAAFENAVWHARGMNMIATLNVLLSLLSAVIVMWRLTLLALSLATLTDLVSSMLQPNAERPLSNLPLSTLVEMLVSDDHVAETVSSAAAAIAEAQVAVATYTPLLATQIRSPKLNLRGRDLEATSFSGSLLPAEERSARLNGSIEDDQPAAREHATRTQPIRLGTPFSLPVSRETHSVFCPRLPEGFSQRSTLLMQKLPRAWQNRLLQGSRLEVEMALRQLGLQANGAGVFSLVESMYASTEAPALLCGHPSPPLAHLKQILWKIAERANDESPDKNGALSDTIRSHLRGGEDPLASVQQAKTLFRQWQSSFSVDASALRFGNPAEVWARAQNGSIYLRSTAVVSGQADSLGTTPYFDTDTSTSEKHGVRIGAHAEAYFDCAKAWRECRSDALWRIDWRARLRRVHPYAVLLRKAGARHTDPIQLEAMVASWFERSAKSLGSTSRPPRSTSFIPEFEPIPVQGTPTFRSREISDGSVADDTLLDAFLARQGTANSVIH